MPYNANKDLPERVRHVLPAAAQSIFRESFNSAIKQYRKEDTAFAVAWSAVKRKYVKSGDKWVKV